MVDNYDQLYEIVGDIYPRLCDIGTTRLGERPEFVEDEEEPDTPADDDGM